MSPPVKVRTWRFASTGALGGLLGWGLTEIGRRFQEQGGGLREDVLQTALYFAGFGLAVGATLGLTEGWVRKDRNRLLYGLFIGLVLGAVGGWAGGALGQVVYGIYPHKYAGPSRTDLVVALDSSGSMKRHFFFGNDPWGRRRKAARKLIDRLSPDDRIAIVDFDHEARVRLPLTRLDDSVARRAAHLAVSQIDDRGGTNLTAGVRAALSELLSHPAPGRDRFVIFLTDGRDSGSGFDPTALRAARQADVAIHTVGLGSGVDPGVLEDIAQWTGGTYYPVARAGDLVEVFDRIFTRSMGRMTDQEVAHPPAMGELLTPEWVLLTLRVVSWGLVGLLIGLGQGVRENTREDVRACGFGGLLGGALGGALFEVAGPGLGVRADLVGRLIADVTVGACIGGAMRLAQGAAGTDRKETTTLLSALPKKGTSLSKGS